MIQRIRDTSLRVQFAGKPSTNNVQLASGGSEISGLPPTPINRLCAAAVAPDATSPRTLRSSISWTPSTPPIVGLPVWPTYDGTCCYIPLTNFKTVCLGTIFWKKQKEKRGIPKIASSVHMMHWRYPYPP